MKDVESGPLVKAGVSVIRVSGSNAFDCIKEMTKENLPFPDFRKATVRSILDSKSKNFNPLKDRITVVVNKYLWSSLQDTHPSQTQMWSGPT